MAEFSLKDTLIGGGILFGIGVFIKKIKGKKEYQIDTSSSEHLRSRIPFRFSYPEYDTHCWDCGQNKRLENDARCWSCNRSEWVRCDKCMKRGSPVICDQFSGGDAGHFTCKKCFFKDQTIDEWVEAIRGEGQYGEGTHWIWPYDAYDEELEGYLERDNWGGDPNGQLAKALARAREDSKKPREPLKIERLDAETEDSPPIEYSSYGRRINYLEMIYNAFYDPESSIYQLSQATISEAISYGEGFILPETAIFFDLRNGSSQLDGQRLSFMYGGNRGSRNKLKTNVKNALQRASGTKLSSSGRLHHGGLIGADYEYNGKMFFIRYNMRGRGNSRRTTLSVASQDSIPEYRRGEYPFSRAYEHENDYKYQGGAETFGAETRKLKKDSCCCGATKKNPCECMYQGISPCSSTCPCALENKKKEQSKGHMDFGAESDEKSTTVQSLITWINSKPNPNRYGDAPDVATQLPKGDYLITNTIDTSYNLNSKNPDKWVKEEVPYRYHQYRLNEGDIITLKGTSTLYYDRLSNWKVCNYQYKNLPYDPSISQNVIRGISRGLGPKILPDASWVYLGKTPHAYNKWIAQPENRIKVARAIKQRENRLIRDEHKWRGRFEDGFDAESDEKREVQKYRIGDMKIREYDDGTLERYEAQRIQYDYLVHREPRGTEVDDDGNRIPNPRGGRFTSADAESFSAFDPKDPHDKNRYSYKRTNAMEQRIVNESSDQFASPCPCGCNGKIEYHDDRSYGCWECPRCGEDSDADMGEDCSYCVKVLDMEDNPQNYPSYQAENFEADFYDPENEGRFEENLECSWCGEPYDETMIYDSFKGRTIHRRCAESSNYDAETFESETVAFESFAGRWNVGQTKEIEGVQLTKLTSGRNAGFRMEYDGHVGEIVANDERRNGGFFVFEGGGLGTGGSYRGLSASDQRECLIRWKHKVGGGTLVIRRPFKKARAILASNGRYRPYSGVFRPPSEAVSRANTFIRNSDRRVQAGRPPRKNEEWLGIRYDAETLGAEEVNGGYNDCCSSENIVVHHRGGANYHDDDKELSYYPAECSVCGVEYDAGLSMYGNSSSIQDLEVSALGAETFEADDDWADEGIDPTIIGYCYDCNSVKPNYGNCKCVDDSMTAESFSAETFLANEMPFKSFWLVAKKGSKSFPAGQVGELRVYENGERTIVLDNNLIIPFYNQDLAYAYLNEHFMVYPKKGTTDKGMLMRAEGDHDDHDHDHEDIDELIEKINRVTDFAITFIHDGGFGGEPKGIIIDEELGLKTEIVNYVEGSIDLRLVRDLETNELVSVRFALTGDPDETPILYLPLPEQLTTVPEEERRIKES